MNIRQINCNLPKFGWQRKFQKECMMRYAYVSDKKANGVVYTPCKMADYLAGEMVDTLSPKKLTSIRVLDPAIGDGELVLSLLNRVFVLNPNAEITVIGFETDSTTISVTKKRIAERYPAVHLKIHNSDFIETAIFERFLPGTFDYIIANPPYVRTQILGAEKARYLAGIVGLSGRVDIYYAFIILAKKLLSLNGVAGFITSNKFMTIKAGKTVREYLENCAYLKQVTDFGDTKLFEAAVLPCIIIFSGKDYCNGKPNFTSIYQTKKADSSIRIDIIFDAINQSGVFTLRDGRNIEIKQGKLTTDNSGGPWRLSTSESTTWLDRIKEKTWKRFSDIGKIRVGIKTTADNVFIKEYWPDNDLTPELLMPLITHRNAGQILPDNDRFWKVLYTHTVINGKKSAVNLETYPNSMDYLQRHRKQLESREYIKNAKRNWYEIWVPQNPEAWKNRKIVFRDISETPQFWLDESGAVVNGDCYWIDIFSETSDDELMLALAVANSSFIEEYYDVKFNNKLYAGKRRFMTQYVNDFPLPNPSSEAAKKVVSLVRTVISNNRPCDQAVKIVLDNAVRSLFS